MECFPTDSRIVVAVPVGEERFKTDSGFVETKVRDEAEECIGALSGIAGGITSVWRRGDCSSCGRTCNVGKGEREEKQATPQSGIFEDRKSTRLNSSHRCIS